jgi:predicted nuclease of predicted toxin-antitoxin system
MKLLLDMNLSPALAADLRAAGFEAEHWNGHGPAGAEDTEIMAFAKKNEYVVVTHDLDFSAILAATNGDKPSVVQVRAANLAPQLLVGPLILGLRRCAADLESGALLTIEAERQRLRLLPLNVRRWD